MSMFTDFAHPRYWLAWCGILLLRLLALLPLPAIALLGNGLGSILYMLMRKRRHITLVNLAICFPEKSAAERKKIARRCFQLVAQTTLGIGINWWSSPARLRRLVSFSGKQHFDAAIASGRNIIVLAPHAIALEKAGLLLSLEQPMISMYQRSKNPLFEAMIVDRRGRFGGKLFERNAPMRHLLKLIRQQNPFYYLPDQDGGQRGVFVPFFGQSASTFPVLSRFAELSDAVVLPCYTTILPAGKGWHVTIRPPLENFPVRDQLEDTRRMNVAIEELVRENPEQYFWVHKRFKTQPDGAEDVYRSTRV